MPLEGTKNVRFMGQRGMDVKFRSFCVGRRAGSGKEITGFAVPHGESNTISSHLTDHEHSYQPSCYYVYNPSAAAKRSLKELRKRNYIKQPRRHVLSLDQIKQGYDAVGALLMFENPGKPGGAPPPKAWWVGTVLSTKDVKKMGYNYSGPTTVQVAVSLLSVAKWILQNPRKGLLTPEQVPFEFILGECGQYLGRVVSEKVDFKPPKSFSLQDFIVDIKPHRKHVHHPNQKSASRAGKK
jgi:homospermidine synthase